MIGGSIGMKTAARNLNRRSVTRNPHRRLGADILQIVVVQFKFLKEEQHK